MDHQHISTTLKSSLTNKLNNNLVSTINGCRIFKIDHYNRMIDHLHKFFHAYAQEHRIKTNILVRLVPASEIPLIISFRYGMAIEFRESVKRFFVAKVLL